MQKTTLARILGSEWPRTHAARFPINDEGRFHAYFGAKEGGKSRFDPGLFPSSPAPLLWAWIDEAASIDEKAWGRLRTAPKSDPWKPLTREEIFSDIKKLGEACYGVQEEVCKAYERMTGKK